MIVAAFVVIFGIVVALLLGAFVVLPALPSEFVGYLSMFFNYMADGVGILNNFMYGAPVGVAITFWLACFGFKHGIRLVKWVANLIPSVHVD